MLFVQLLARFAVYNIAMRESTKIKLSPDTDLAFAKNGRDEKFALIATDYFDESDLETWRDAILREALTAKIQISAVRLRKFRPERQVATPRAADRKFTLAVRRENLLIHAQIKNRGAQKLRDFSWRRG